MNDTSDELHLIGVAEVHYWHGFDRLVRGLAAYYDRGRSYKVYFHIVGELTANANGKKYCPSSVNTGWNPTSFCTEPGMASNWTSSSNMPISG